MMSITAEPSRRLHRQRSRVESHASFSHGTVPHLVALADFAIVLASSVVGVVGYHFAAFGLFADPAQNVGIGLLTATLFVLAMSCLRAYGYHELLSVRHQSMLIALLVPGVLAFLLTVLFFLKLGDTFSRGAVLTLAGMSVGGLIGARLFWRRHLRRAVAGGRLRLKNTCFICPEAMAGEDLERIARGGGMRIAQIARLDGASPLPALVRRASATGAGAIEEVVIVWRDEPVSGLEALLDDLRMLPLPVKVIFDNFTGAVVSCQAESLGGVSAFQVQSPPLVWVERTAKRLFDIMFALSALLLLAPMLVLVALAIKLDSPGPVLFAQRRLGHASKPFRILKFRSMSVMEDGDEVRQATRADKRVTRVGAFIRSTSIDELPQFWNVLHGEMSVVGPRPHAVAHDDVYDTLIVEYAARRHMKPGLTGWAQVKGCRGETPTVEAMQQRVTHDLWYIDNWSLWLDVKIVLRTVLALRGV